MQSPPVKVMWSLNGGGRRSRRPAGWTPRPPGWRPWTNISASPMTDRVHLAGTNIGPGLTSGTRANLGRTPSWPWCRCAAGASGTTLPKQSGGKARAPGPHAMSEGDSLADRFARQRSAWASAQRRQGGLALRADEQRWRRILNGLQAGKPGGPTVSAWFPTTRYPAFAIGRVRSKAVQYSAMSCLS